LRFERRYPEENAVARLTSNILTAKFFGPPNIFGLSTPLCHCIAASPVKDVWGQQSHAEKRINYRNFKLTLEIRCHVIVTQQRATVEQYARKFRNV